MQLFTGTCIFRILAHLSNEINFPYRFKPRLPMKAEAGASSGLARSVGAKLHRTGKQGIDGHIQIPRYRYNDIDLGGACERAALVLP